MGLHTSVIQGEYEHIMIRIALLFFILIIFLPGCVSGRSIKYNTDESVKTVTEHGNIQKIPLVITDRHIGIVHMESSNQDNDLHPGSDTGAAGIDSVFYRVSMAGEQRFCFKDDDGEPHRMVMKDVRGGEVIRITADGGCSSVMLEPGDYLMEIYHGGDIIDKKADTVFIYYGDFTVQSSRGSFTDRSPESGNIKEKTAILLRTNYCVGCNLQNADLKNASLANANLRNANLSGSNLNRANLINAYLQGADLTGADLTGAEMYHANLRYANLSNANLNKADLKQAILAYTNLSGANLSYTKLVKGYLSSARLVGADLSNADLTGADMRFADLTNAKLTRADLSAAYLYSANLTGADMRFADLSNADISYVNFTGADLSSANLKDASRSDETDTYKPGQAN
jgi:uncharacterized protein YjbI with pentapeptide repeats